jgi:hypothetical protein
MDIGQIVLNILYMPSAFKKLGNVSMIDLIKQSGYVEVHDQVNKHMIKDALELHRECIKDWIISSEDQRTDKGWYITDGKPGKYVVGYSAIKGGSFELPEFENVEDACAEYIIKEIESLRSYCR